MLLFHSIPIYSTSHILHASSRPGVAGWQQERIGFGKPSYTHLYISRSRESYTLPIYSFLYYILVLFHCFLSIYVARVSRLAFSHIMRNGPSRARGLAVSRIWMRIPSRWLGQVVFHGLFVKASYFCILGNGNGNGDEGGNGKEG